MFYSVKKKPYASTKTNLPEDYLLYIYLIYYSTMSNSKLGKMIIKKSTIMEANFLYLLALSPTEQYKPAQKNSFNLNFTSVEINHHS